MIRRAAVGAVVLGAGLASTTGVAMATECSHGHDHDHGSHGHGQTTNCLNAVDQHNATEGGGFADVLGGAQTAVPVNVCHVLDDNHVLNNIDIAVLGSIV